MEKPSIQIWLELETRCNLKCKFCYNYWKDGTVLPPKQLSTAQTIEGLKRLFGVVNCKSISISGGEPLLRTDLYEILSFIKSYNVPMVLTSNGTLLTRQTITDLINAGIVTFQIPFHSTNSETHNLLSGKDCWEETLRAIVLLKESSADLLTVFVATNKNLNDFCQVLEVCRLLNINEVIFNRFIPSGLGTKYKETLGVPTDKALIPILKKANETARRLDLIFHLGVPIKLPSNVINSLDRMTIASCPVSFGQSRWTIDAECNIRRCNHSGDSIGNLLKGGIETLLNDLQKGSCSSRKSSKIQCCQFLEPSNLYQIKVR